MEGNCPKKDANIAARSSEPFIQIDSIFIDLICSDDIIDCGKCEHFSVRQFVSESRKKDWKKCWPFGLDGNQECEDQTCLLPPLEIPNFSWWRCPNCQQKISSKDFYNIPKQGTPEKVEISNFTNLTDNCNPCLRTGMRGNRAQVVCSMTGSVSRSEDEANMEIHRLSISAPKIKSSVVLQCINDSVAPKPESNGFRESCRRSCGDGALEHSIMNVKVNGKKISLDADCRVLFEASDIGRVLYKAHNAVTVRYQSKSSPCTKLNRRKLSASELAEISSGKDIQESLVHKPAGSLRRKKRKLRLLTELLGENRSMENKQVEVAVDSPSNETSDASTGQDALYIPPSQLIIQGNTSQSSGKSRKRKMLRNGEWRPRAITSCNKYKNIMALKQDVIINDCRKSCEYENPSQTGLQMGKSLRSDGDYISCGKKYKKKAKELYPGFALLQFGENGQQEIHEKRGRVYSWMDSCSSEGAKSESKSSMSKNKGKMETPFVLDKYLPRLGKSREDEFSERGLSLSSYIAAQRLDTNCIPQGLHGVIQSSGKAILNNRQTESTSHFPSPAFVTHTTPFPTEDSVCFTLQRMGIAGPSSCTKRNEVQEGMATTNKRENCKRVDEVYEKGAAEDIPMEIVELMAKNQFERETENKKRLPQTMSITGNALAPCYCNSQKQGSQAKNKIKCVISAREVMGPNKQHSVDYLSHISGCHVSTNRHLQQMQSSEDYGAVLQAQEKPYGEIQYSAAGSTKTGDAQKEKYAFRYNLPQNCSYRSMSADKASNSHISRDRGTLSAQRDLKFHNENSINIEKKISVSYSYQCSPVEKIQKSATKSLQFCSNESIPAMHLLNLLDAGMQPTPGGMPRFPRKLKPNEFSGIAVVSNNKIDALRFPSSDCLPARSSQQGIRASYFSGQFASKSPKKKCVVTKDGRGSGNRGVKNWLLDPTDSKLVKKKSSSQRMFGESSLNAMVRIGRRVAECVMCSVNRNPSDFSLPEAGNIYTIGGSDLKFRQSISHPNQFDSTHRGTRKHND